MSLRNDRPQPEASASLVEATKSVMAKALDVCLNLQRQVDWDNIDCDNLQHRIDRDSDLLGSAQPLAQIEFVVNSASTPASRLQTVPGSGSRGTHLYPPRRQFSPKSWDELWGKHRPPPKNMINTLPKVPDSPRSTDGDLHEENTVFQVENTLLPEESENQFERTLYQQDVPHAMESQSGVDAAQHEPHERPGLHEHA
ncbi:MAG: hypothetical protein M1828_000117 [Chrysothrix sp. TS-e1954]|nr:MAG: hypothetical protein M1828_000117 [Chrysothrix sp. TS-e1954]